MTIERFGARKVIEDHHVLEPGGTLMIDFMPDDGPAIASVYVQNAANDVIMGASPDLIPDGPPIIPPGPAEPPAPDTGGGFGAGLDLIGGADVAAAPGIAVAPRAQPLIVNPAMVGLMEAAGAAAIGGAGGAGAPEVPGAQPLIVNPAGGPVAGFEDGSFFELPDPVPPGDPVDVVNIKVIRPARQGEGKEVVVSRDVPTKTGVSFAVADLPPLLAGLARQVWQVRFTNISNRPMQIFGRILFRRRLDAAVTRIPVALMSRLMRQAVRGLELEVQLKGSEITVKLNPHVLKLMGRAFPITADVGVDVFGDVSLDEIAVSISSVDMGAAGRVPVLTLKIGFEETGAELKFDLGTDIEINLRNLEFDIELRLTQILDNLNPAGIFGEELVAHKIAAQTDFRSDIRIHSDLGGDIVDAGIAVADYLSRLGDDDDDKPKVSDFNDAVVAAGNEFSEALAPILSSYVQMGLNRIADQDGEFLSLRMAGEDWEILTTATENKATQLPLNAPNIQPMANAQPIDGPQPAEELVALKRIKHVVILMMENRSYDHVLGHLSHRDHGRDPRYDGLRGGETNPVPGLRSALSTPLTTPKFFPSPPHGFDSVARQINGGQMDGFGKEFRRTLRGKGIAGDARSIMGYNPPGMFETYDRFVRDYAVAKRWFSSLPGATWPNRFCVHCGQTPILNNSDAEDTLGYLTTPTMYELLEKNGVDWRCYEHDVAFLRMFDRYRLNTSNIRHFSEFEDDAAAPKKLPPVTVIEPNFFDIPGDGNPEGKVVQPASDDHPAGADIRNGQRLIAQVYNILRATDEWDDTMFIVTYDEHGGFYDHYAPPGSALSPDQGLEAVQKVHPDAPAMLGVRVPAFVISPRAKKGDILSRIYDHGSIVKTVLALFAPGTEHLMGRRVETSAHLGGAVMLAEARKDTPKNYPVPAGTAPAENQELDAESFHDDMISLGNPMRADAQRMARMARRPFNP